jgi:hypothetical protein
MGISLFISVFRYNNHLSTFLIQAHGLKFLEANEAFKKVKSKKLQLFSFAKLLRTTTVLLVLLTFSDHRLFKITVQSLLSTLLWGDILMQFTCMRHRDVQHTLFLCCNSSGQFADIHYIYTLNLHKNTSRRGVPPRRFVLYTPPPVH